MGVNGGYITDIYSLWMLILLDSAQLVYNSNFTMVYGTYNYSSWGL